MPPLFRQERRKRSRNSGPPFVPQESRCGKRPKHRRIVYPIPREQRRSPISRAPARSLSNKYTQYIRRKEQRIKDSSKTDTQNPSITRYSPACDSTMAVRTNAFQTVPSNLRSRTVASNRPNPPAPAGRQSPSSADIVPCTRPRIGIAP